MTDRLIAPHGGTLCSLMLAEDQHATVKHRAAQLPALFLNARQICDLELLIDGGFSPLRGFMTRRDYESVRDDLRLSDNTVWPMPITLDVSREFAAELSTDSEIALRDEEGRNLAILDVNDVWEPDLAAEARAVFGTTDRAHPAVRYLLEQSGPVYLGGALRGLAAPRHYDFRHLRRTPQQLRNEFSRLGWGRVVGFQTRNPMHRAHLELTFRAAQRAEANLLLHPVVGLTKPGDIDHYTRVRCYEALLKRFPEQTTMLSLLPLAMRMGGPREALWHALIRKNYGCSHFIVGRDHAGPGIDSRGEPFYAPYAAQDLVTELGPEIGVEMVTFQNMVYIQEKAQYIPDNEVSEGETVLAISGTELRRRLREGIDIPDWFTFPEVTRELRQSYPARHKQGFTVFFTGLSGAGKSTIANALLVRLMELGDRPVTLLDGDVVRRNLSSELGFSREHRDINVMRIGYVASEITKNGGVAICAPIAPYEATRQAVRESIEPLGGFLEIHVDTPLEVCEARDTKGLYRLAREGKISDFTGISDPYEAPPNPELRLDTSEFTPEQSVQRIILKLEQMGLIRGRTRNGETS